MSLSQACILVIFLPLVIGFIIALIDEIITNNFSRKLRVQLKRNMRIEQDTKDEMYFKRMLREGL